MLCMSAIRTMHVRKYVGSVYIGGYGGLSENGLCVFRKLWQVSFLIVGVCPSALLKSAVISHSWCV